MEWKIFYDDFSTFSSVDGPPEESPALGVQAIVMPDSEVGRTVDAKREYYWWIDDRWDGGDIFGLFDYLSRPGFKVVRFGRSMTNESFRAVYDVAANDPDFPRKSAVRAGEHVPA